MLRFSEDLIPMMKVLCPGDNMDQIGPVKERLNLDKDVSYKSNLAVYINVKKVPKPLILLYVEIFERIYGFCPGTQHFTRP